jgi:alkaline phosphatase D
MNYGTLLLVMLLLAAETGQDPAAEKFTAGPMVGAVQREGARVWCRATKAQQTIDAILVDAAGAEVARASAVSSEERDLTVDLLLKARLEAGHRYHYRILIDGTVAADDADQVVVGPPDANGKTRLVFGSCASPKKYREGQIWNTIRSQEADALVLIGDTPYIDSTDLSRQRRAYRSFWQDPGVAALIRRTPVLATWDDHDYGKNDHVGLLPGRENSRQAFSEYHALGSIGDGQSDGIYSSHSFGPIDLFILDTRWFGKTEPSQFAADQPTLLGEKQWQWLQQGLQASRAPFKIITCGMIFNGSTRPGKTDHWGHYPHERQGLIDFIGENSISGVLIVTGDIHRCRHLSYPPSEGAGYPLDEWITSPLANTVIESANAPHPSLVFDGGETSVFLHVEADASGPDPSLQVKLVRGDEKVIHRKKYQLSELVAKKKASTGQ